MLEQWIKHCLKKKRKSFNKSICKSPWSSWKKQMSTNMCVHYMHHDNFRCFRHLFKSENVNKCNKQPETDAINNLWQIGAMCVFFKPHPHLKTAVLTLNSTHLSFNCKQKTKCYPLHLSIIGGVLLVIRVGKPDPCWWLKIEHIGNLEQKCK